MKRMLAIIVLGMFVLPHQGWGEAPDRWLVIPPGISHMHLTGNKQPDTIIKAWRENYNAHGFFVLTFLNAVTGNSNDSPLNIITIQDGENGPHANDTSISTSQGADCVLTDYRLLKQGKHIFLVKAARAYGDSYVSAEKVTFSFYRMQRNREGTPGQPEYAFVKFAEQQSAQPYCDVGDALDKETLRIKGAESLKGDL